MKGTYLYAIMAGEHRLALGRVGLPDGSTPVITLPGNGLSVVVGTYRGDPFGDLPKAALLRGLAIHQQVIERGMFAYPVLPVRFGTTLASFSEARAILGRWQGRLASALRQLDQAVEIEVVATWDLRRTFGEIASLPEIAALAATAEGRSPDETLEVRVQVGRLVKEALDRRREEYRRWVVQELAAIAREAQPNPTPTDELVFNVAFLVERARLDDFYAQIHRLDEALGQRLTFRCVGPLPPYTFATVEIAHPSFEQIEAGRRLLELGDRVSESELNATYRRLAVRLHPDHHPEDAEASKHFAALTAAYTTLLAYLRGQGTTAEVALRSRRDGAESEDNRYDLSRSAVEGVPLLAIKRSGSTFFQDVEYGQEPEAALV